MFDSGRMVGFIINRMIVGRNSINDCKPNLFEFNNV